MDVVVVAPPRTRVAADVVSALDAQRLPVHAGHPGVTPVVRRIAVVARQIPDPEGVRGPRQTQRGAARPAGTEGTRKPRAVQVVHVARISPLARAVPPSGPEPTRPLRRPESVAGTMDATDLARHLCGARRSRTGPVRSPSTRPSTATAATGPTRRGQSRRPSAPLPDQSTSQGRGFTFVPRPRASRHVGMDHVTEVQPVQGHPLRSVDLGRDRKTRDGVPVREPSGTSFLQGPLFPLPEPRS